MRYVIYGAGAIGATLGASLHVSGHEVVLIARGAHYDALAKSGLSFTTVEGTLQIDIPVVDHPSKAGLSHGDVVLLAMKGQDSVGALQTLSTCAPQSVEIVCAQNGVDNERSALRLFPHVHAMCVLCPATHLAPGEVIAHSGPIRGVFDLGRFPSGTDGVDEQIAADLSASNCASQARPDIMSWKYAKLLRNLANATEALFTATDLSDSSGSGSGGSGAGGGGADAKSEITARAKAEAVACLAGAGVVPIDDATWAERHRVAHVTPATELTGAARRQGGSTWQSLARGTGAVETDYLNGEIVLLGRLQGIATPVNELLQRLSTEAARAGGPPGQLSADDALAQLG